MNLDQPLPYFSRFAHYVSPQTGDAIFAHALLSFVPLLRTEPLTLPNRNQVKQENFIRPLSTPQLRKQKQQQQ